MQPTGSSHTGWCHKVLVVGHSYQGGLPSVDLESWGWVAAKPRGPPGEGSNSAGLRQLCQLPPLKQQFHISFLMSQGW